MVLVFCRVEKDWGDPFVCWSMKRSGVWSLCSVGLEEDWGDPFVCWSLKRSGVWSLSSVGLEGEWG